MHGIGLSLPSWRLFPPSIDRGAHPRYCLIMKQYALIGIRASLLVALLLAWSCSRGGGGKVEEPTTDSPSMCAVTPEEAVRRGGTIRIALPGGIDRTAIPFPPGEGARLFCRNLYETLTERTCEGKVMPAIARHWSGPDSSGAWTVTIDGDTRFWSGEVVRAVDVAKSWEGTAKRLSTAGVASPWDWFPAGEGGIRAVDDSTLVIDPGIDGIDLPVILSHPAFAVTGPPVKGALPEGTGPWRIAEGAKRGKSLIPCVRNPYSRVDPAGADTLLFDVRRPGSDLRDLPFDQLDLVVMRDGGAVDYAATLPWFTDTALPWNRTVFLLLADSKYLARLEKAFAGYPFRESVARDVAEADARPIEPEEAEKFERIACPAEKNGPAADPPLENGTAYVLYPKGSTGASSIASRVAAIARSPVCSLVGVTAAGASAGRLRRSPEGTALAAVLPVDAPLRDGCSARASLSRRVPWIVEERPESGRSPAVLPLVESRAHLFARKGLAGISVDYRGTILLAKAGWRAEAALP